MYKAAVSEKVCNLNKIDYHNNRSFNKKQHAFRLHIKIAVKVIFWSSRPSLRRLTAAVYRSDALPYMRGNRILRLIRVRSYLNNYFAMYTRLMRSRIHVEHASPAGLRSAII